MSVVPATTGDGDAVLVSTRSTAGSTGVSRTALEFPVFSVVVESDATLCSSPGIFGVTTIARTAFAPFARSPSEHAMPVPVGWQVPGNDLTISPGARYGRRSSTRTFLA